MRKRIILDKADNVNIQLINKWKKIVYEDFEAFLCIINKNAIYLQRNCWNTQRPFRKKCATGSCENIVAHKHVKTAI